MRRFISDGTWFEKGTEVKLIDDYGEDKIVSWPCRGLFEGIHEDQLDQEICSFREFEIIGDAPQAFVKEQKLTWKIYTCIKCNTQIHTVNVPNDRICLLCWKAAQQ